MTKVVILGAGFGGLTVFHHMVPWINKAGVSVTIVDQRETFLIKPSLPEVAMGEKTLDHTTFPLRAVVEHHAQFIHSRVDRIDPERQQIFIDGAVVPYDILVIALGAHKDWNGVTGFADYGHSMCTDVLAPRLYEAMKEFRQGQIVVGSAPTPTGHRLPDVPRLATACEGPVGEIAFMADYWLRQKNLRAQSEIICYTPGDVFFDDVGDNVHQAFNTIAQQQSIQVMTNKVIEHIEKDRVWFHDGSSIASALTVMVPTYRGPQVVIDAGLTDDAGFIPTDHQFRHSDFDNIFAIGDIASRSQPKLGHLAVEQGILVASVLRQQLTGNWELADYYPEVFCIMNMGVTAMVIRSDVLWGGTMDQSYYGRLSHLLKTSFDEYTRRFKGKMPPELTMRLFNAYMDKISEKQGD
ncbi:NAD(P)/FAD-dependent oxidoreductase [Sulfobacillus thermosulfidooxidans]|uniref:NAD(P)/FAD-dependent oxidoreductase n=1 Tax=Sulfobacillus thermosulfidooxidans TaxID=28034 RepID=UPI0004094F16|nr:FAD-dependent oxidoreductase [Sulfobacillus thermosulfidooxidans]